MNDAISAKHKREIPDTWKLAYQIPEAVEATGLCRSNIYMLIKTGQLPIRKFGKRTLILADDLKTLMQGLPLGGPEALLKQKQKQSHA
jgi:excisionase family DNA binding protein